MCCVYAHTLLPLSPPSRGVQVLYPFFSLWSTPQTRLLAVSTPNCYRQYMSVHACSTRGVPTVTTTNCACVCCVLWVWVGVGGCVLWVWVGVGGYGLWVWVGVGGCVLWVWVGVGGYGLWVCGVTTCVFDAKTLLNVTVHRVSFCGLPWRLLLSTA